MDRNHLPPLPRSCVIVSCLVQGIYTVQISEGAMVSSKDDTRD